MLITRLDAMHPAGDGAFCRFFFAGPDVPGPRTTAARLATNGWEVDVYPEELGPLNGYQQMRLMDEVWPLMPTSTLLEWIASPSQADVDGDEIFEPGGQPCKK